MKCYLILILVFGACNVKEEKKIHNTMEKNYIKKGLSVNCKSLNKEEFYEMVNAGKRKPLEEYRKEYGIDVYEISKEKILVCEAGYYTLYYDISDLDSVLIDNHGEVKSFEILQNSNPYGIDFPKYTTKLTDDLIKAIDLKGINVLKPQSLVEVNEKMNSFDDNGFVFKDKFINIIALIGEVLRVKYNASWVMKLSNDKITWNPYLKIGTKEINFFGFLYEDIFEDSNTESCIPETYQAAVGIIDNNIIE
jgi:hypothetical protein